MYRWCGDGADVDVGDDGGIDYAVDEGPYVQGQTVTVTATLVGGGAELVWVDPLPDPWRPGTPAATVASVR